MSELIAWGDESVQTQGGVTPTYYMGACICGLEERNIRNQLFSATKRKVPKLHWRDMTLSEKRKSIPIIETLSLPHIVVAATPLDGMVTSERARRKCLELLLPALEREYGVSRLILESREASQDDRDLVFVRGLRSRRFISRLRVDFAPGSSDARLWIADQVLGAIGDEQRGRRGFSSFLKTLDMRELDLRHLA
ncbi:hypothetical protein [Bifidobacterium panos]|uniref:DUF3800 domain-containing protein n=1 Tax=Bifidobacterium panos TaxID=2675321 RepID=A0ABX1SWY4_9BIFI|nr:hypothetical protein [Bifidobacterium sp. DSM 109963]NMN02346.1 hypothetical protein [Bifidobacterium sp. DSM 109963]